MIATTDIDSKCFHWTTTEVCGHCTNGNGKIYIYNIEESKTTKKIVINDAVFVAVFKTMTILFLFVIWMYKPKPREPPYGPEE